MPPRYPPVTLERLLRWTAASEAADDFELAELLRQKMEEVEGE